MAAVARHLRLPRHTFDTHLAYNTKAKRGLRWWGRANAEARDRATRRHGEYSRGEYSQGGEYSGREAARGGVNGGAPAVNASGAEASEATMRSLRRLMAPSVRSLDELLRAASRPGVPAQWLQAAGGRGASAAADAGAGPAGRRDSAELVPL